MALPTMPPGEASVWPGPADAPAVDEPGVPPPDDARGDEGGREHHDEREREDTGSHRAKRSPTSRSAQEGPRPPTCDGG